jgi:hypothetical protein
MKVYVCERDERGQMGLMGFIHFKVDNQRVLLLSRQSMGFILVYLWRMASTSRTGIEVVTITLLHLISLYYE